MMCDDINNNIFKNNELNEFLISLMGDRKIPPLDRWSPTCVTSFDVVIQDNGDWYHEGIKMTRKSLVDLFASVLWAEYDNGKKRYFLKTPSDKYEIRVVDVPLFINQVDKISQNGDEWIVFTTTHGDVIVLDDEPLYFKTFTNGVINEQRLYINTRFHLTARIYRHVFYHLVALGELIEDDGRAVLLLNSGGKVHRVVDDFNKI